jgi:hypothetical protein
MGADVVGDDAEGFDAGGLVGCLGQAGTPRDTYGLAQ